jgi:hypothetical protein
MFCVEFEHKEDEDFFTLGAQTELQQNAWFDAFMVTSVRIIGN